MLPMDIFLLNTSTAPIYTVMIMLRPINVIIIGKNRDNTNWSLNDLSLYSILFSENTEEKLSSLTNDLMSLIPEKVSWT